MIESRELEAVRNEEDATLAYEASAQLTSKAE